MADKNYALRSMQPGQRKWIADGAPGYGHLREDAQRMVDESPDEHADIMPLEKWKAEGLSSSDHLWKAKKDGSYEFARGGKVLNNKVWRK